MSGSEPRPYDLERDRGVLTESDRNYLVGNSDLSEQGERDARYRIRNRIKNSMFDMMILDTYLEEEDQRQVAEGIFNQEQYGNGVLLSVLRFIFKLHYRVCDGNWVDKLESILTTTIKRRLEEENEGSIVNVSIDIGTEIRDPDISKLVDKYEKGVETWEELRYLRDEGEIEADDTYWRHQFQHHWDADDAFRLYHPENGVRDIDPEDYSSQDEFIEECFSALEETREKVMDDSEEGN